MLVAIVLQNSAVLVFFLCVCVCVCGGGRGYCTLVARYVAKKVSQRCTCVKLSTRGGSTPFWGAANLPENVSHDMGYRSDGIAISRDMGPLSSARYAMLSQL